MSDVRPVEWDAGAYDRISDPQFGWGMSLLNAVELRGDETVLDAGCGSGRLAEELLSRLPRGKVVALDYSENMVLAARERLAKFGDRVEVIQGDIANFRLATSVDGIFSNAVFHWVPDHNALFRSLYAALKSGGWLLSQFGGEGNLQRLKQRVQLLLQTPEYAHYFESWKDGSHFETEEATRDRLQQAGFDDIQTRLHPEPTTFPDRATYAMFIRKVNIHRYVAKLPPEQEQRFLEYLADQAAHDNPPFTLDYMRLTVRARRP